MTKSMNFTQCVNAVRRYRDLFLKDPNVVGVGVGTKQRRGASTGDTCVVFLVARKLAPVDLPGQAALPASLDSGGGRQVPTDVVETGHFYQHENTERMRPAHPGGSCGVDSVPGGTFGGVVVDNVTGERMVLSNNHVLADNNRAPVGSPIVQPGTFDGGEVPQDTLARLERFVELVPEWRGTNRVDAALARPVAPEIISGEPLNGVPVPSSMYPAVGLLWGGSTARTLFSPVIDVLASLNARMPVDDAVLAPTLGLGVQKAGRTTERTVGEIQEVELTVKVYVPSLLGTAIFVNQFSTSPMSKPGDSGSVAVTEQPQG